MSEGDRIFVRDRRCSFLAVFFGIALAIGLLAIPLWRMYRAKQHSRFDELILKAAGENGCDPCLIKAVVWRESKFDPSVHGEHGELGLMQVMPVVASEWATSRGLKDLKPDDVLQPEINLRIGSWYLSKALQQWTQASEPIPLALSQYNAGRSNVLKWVDANSLADPEHFIERIQFPSTRSYVRNILKQYQLYRNRGEF